MKVHRIPLILALVAMALLAGCGDEGSDDGEAGPAAMAAGKGEAGGTGGEAPPQPKPAEEASGPQIVARDSEFGRVLVDSNDQAIYIFENDEPGRSNCSGQCAADWPPVLTEDSAVAGRGVKASLLGATKRDDGTTQVTYGDKPLYYYSHEGPGQILCHNVNLNGGYWWVIGPNGKRRP